MARIVLNKLSKHFKGVKAVDNISLEIREGEFLSLLGPSGCGKTTTLRLIAGLETPTSGEIFFDEKTVTKLPPAKRNVAMVFQSYALYPHMTAFENIAFALEVRGVAKDERKKMVEDIAVFLRIEDLLDRKPAQLSGGQRQRVALARSIVRSPSVYLMDEPLSNLDAKLRLLMRAELKKLQEKLKVTTVYVTHDQIEAMTMSNRVAIMNDGAIQQIGTADELYSRPASTWVAGFIGSPPMNLVDCSLTESEDEKLLDAGEFIIHLDEDLGNLLMRNAGSAELTLGVRPGDLSIHSETQPNSIKGKIHTLEPVGEYAIVNVAVGDYLIRAKVDPAFSGAPEEEVYLTFDERAMYVYERGGKLLT